MVPRFSSFKIRLGEVLEVGRLGVAWVLADRVSWGWPELMRTIGTFTVDLSGALLPTQDIHHWEGLQKQHTHTHRVHEHVM